MDFGPRKIEKRNRAPVSCEPCRARKQMCNRGQPCEGCTRRNQPSLCRYAPNAIRNKTRPSRVVNIQERLDNLESMLSSIVGNPTVAGTSIGAATNNKASSSPVAVSASYSQPQQYCKSTQRTYSQDDRGLPPELPHRHQSGDGQIDYIDPSHWRAILEEIKEVREHLSAFDRPLIQDEPERRSVLPDQGVGFMFGKFPVVDLEEVLSSLPSRSICDALVAQYFNARFMVLGILHPVKFQKEYEKFWDAPSKAPPLWIALLFSVLGLTTTLRQVAGADEVKSTRPTAILLQQRTVECLILGRFPNANAYALEAMILHLQSCYLTLNKLGSDHWFEMGTLIRLAFRMGYHHDPDGLPGISVFDGEMRRRVWHNVFQVDALMSFQMGFPSMIPTEFCDTKVPRNLQFSDLDIGVTVLPPGRPLFENTPIRYPIAKSGIMAVFKKIVAHSQSLALPTYDNTIMLDNEMREAYSGLPEILRGRDVGRSFMDPSSTIFERCTLEMLYLKGLIVLHRRYISYDVDSRLFEHSRRTCAEAALDILARQADLHHASQPGGRLYDDRWMVSSLTMHDFLLAAIVICLDLSVRLRRPPGILVPGRDDDPLAGREYFALQTSQKIWSYASQTSADARLAALALGLMVQKVAEKDGRHFPPSEMSIQDPTSAVSIHGELPYAGPMSQMIDGTEGLDWGLLDQYFQNQPMDGTNLEGFNIDPSWFDPPQ